MAGIEPARTKSPRDFKSLVSTYSTTLAYYIRKRVERETGIEPAAPTLARLCSTTELLPHIAPFTRWLRMQDSNLRPSD